MSKNFATFAYLHLYKANIQTLVRFQTNKSNKISNYGLFIIITNKIDMDFYKLLALHKTTKKLSNKDLGSIIGMEGEAFRMAVNRKSLSNLQIKEIEKMFDFELDKTNHSNNLITEPGAEYYKGVPYYDIDFTASFLVIENNNQIRPDSYISHPFFKGCDYVVRASGQSMAKVICHGDAIGLIKINSWQEFFPFGEIYAIVTNDNFRMIKVITKGDTDEYFTLISKPTDSKKEEFPPQQIKKSSISAIFKVQASSHLF
jgi:hypothetical protein